MQEESILGVKTLENGIVVLSLNRQDAMNALNKSLLEALRTQIRELNHASDARVLILTGAGEKAFCAGADLKERAGMSLEETRAFLRLINDTFNALEGLAIPSIAAINGFALGGGLEMALACDIRIADSKALLGLTECAWGIIPGAGGTQRLPRLVGPSKAKELVLTAKRIDAAEALRIGLVESLSGGGQSAFEHALVIAKQIADNAPLSVCAAKAAIQNSGDLTLDNGLALESECYERVLHSQDRLEGLKAFSEKRKPSFKGH